MSASCWKQGQELRLIKCGGTFYSGLSRYRQINSTWLGMVLHVKKGQKCIAALHLAKRFWAAAIPQCCNGP